MMALLKQQLLIIHVKQSKGIEKITINWSFFAADMNSVYIWYILD